MLLSRTMVVLLGSGLASAHHMITNMIINGVDQGMGKCLRNAPNTNPVVDINSSDMACNVGGTKGVARVCEVDAGSEITFIWRSWPDASQPGSLDVSHQGPCAVYMKLVSDVIASPGAGNGWVKIWHDGYRDGKFCAQRLIENGGRMTVTIPRDFVGGDYLIRAEQLALHQAQNTGGAQWYIGCGQLTVSSTGGSASPAGVPIPGHVKANDPGVLYNYWVPSKPHSQYVIPGPKPYVPGNTGGSHPIEHREEKGDWHLCIVENANWCAKPVPGFKNVAECWNASGNCWTQLNECYNTAPSTGNKGCREWEATCERYQAHCHTCEANRNCNGSFP
ncbi:family 61 glycoside hydrolase [Kalaharituber pfeilii]|nr:family 61 glycoside hydrolase [Kalaharituber pfeilii]